MRALFLRAVSDSHGNISHARIIALLVGFSATLFMWKLTVLGQLTPEYFMYYLGYGVVHMNVSKALDVINNILGRNNGRISPRRGNDGPDGQDDAVVGDGAGVKTTEIG